MKSNSLQRMRFAASLSLAVAVLGWSANSQACSSCGCSVGAEWADAGYSTRPGLKLGLRYDFINQSELRNGTHKATDADVANALANGTVEEQQTDTLTRFYTLSADYGINHDWAVNVQLPYIDRHHGTIADGDTEVSSSSRQSVGDVRVVARYQGLFDDRSLGLQLGIKLPTGGRRQNFSDGPGAGELLDRGLQLGTGTTDVIAGIYHFAAWGRDWDHFEQLQIKLPLNTDDGFKPSAQAIGNLGIRYLGITQLVPQLQLNVKYEGKESGALADRPNSGSTEVYVSPGLSYSVAKAASVYSFVQLPVYRDFNGLQLAPRYTATVGVNYSF